MDSFGHSVSTESRSITSRKRSPIVRAAHKDVGEYVPRVRVSEGEWLPPRPVAGSPLPVNSFVHTCSFLHCGRALNDTQRWFRPAMDLLTAAIRYIDKAQHSGWSKY